MRGRKRKGESRAEELRAELAAWGQLGEFLRPSLRKLAARLGTSEQLLSHYLKTQDEWESRRQAAHCKESGDFRGVLYWSMRASLGKFVRRMEREFKEAGALDRSRIKMLEKFASVGQPGAQKFLAKVLADNLSASSRAAAKSFRSQGRQVATALN